MSRPRALLLVPPSPLKSRPVLRDYYCSTSSKAAYYWQPIDLLAQSGRLARECDVHVLDATAEKLNARAALARIQELRPEYILALAGSVALDDDMTFLTEVVRLTNARLALSGDFPRFEAEAVFARYPCVDAILMDFTAPALTHWWTRGEAAPGIRTREHAPGESPPGTFSYPLPEYARFPLDAYRIPFGRAGRFASILTNYGCPYQCQYCNSGQAGFRLRALDNILEEWDWAHHARVRQVFVKDMTFGVTRSHALNFLEAVNALPYRHHWHCYSRVDILDRDLVTRMKEAGCFLVQLGIESASADVIHSMGRPYDNDTVYSAVEILHEAGIEVGAHFVLGLPGDTHDSLGDILTMAKKLKPTYASFNIGTPRYGSILRTAAVDDGRVEPGLYQMDSSAHIPTPVASDAMTQDELTRLRRSITRRFYLRPGFVWDRLRHVHSPAAATQLAASGWNVLRA